MIQSGQADTVVPTEGARQAVPYVRAYYEKLGIEDRFECGIRLKPVLDFLTSVHDRRMITTAELNTQFGDMDIMGVGIDYVNGIRINVKLYYYGDDVNEHTFYYNKDALIKELYKVNETKTLVDDDGKKIDCSA